jgi:hypothetical protein
MRVPLLCAFALASTLPSFAQDAPWSFSGTVVNTTNPNKAIEGAVTISFSDKECVVRVNPPLVGSGLCNITAFDKNKSTMTIQTEGPAGNITFQGSISGSIYSGTYTVDCPNFKELVQRGTFHFQEDQTPIRLKFADVIEVSTFDKDGTQYNVLREGSTAYIYDKDFKYADIRLILDKDGNPSARIEDHQDGSEYVDVKTNKILARWHCDGTNGYYERQEDGYSSIYNRFMEPTNWSSFNSSGGTYYAYTRGKELELYDKDFKYLKIHSSTTTNGKVLWLKDDDDGFTEYYDANFQPLNWYSTSRDGQTYYVHVIGKKVKVYDAKLQPIKKQHPYWRALGQGLALGLASYGQALQQQAAEAQTDAANSASYGYSSTSSNHPTTYNATTQQIGGFTYSNTTASDGSTYNTTSQQIGNFTYSNTTGSDGYSAQSTRQQIGNFGYINGTSSAGALSGNTQQIGNFTYGNYTTASGSWQSTSQQIGNIEYHTITSPDGTVRTGTTQRIGDFVYTDIQ